LEGREVNTMAFKASRAVITLGAKDLVRLQEILMDGDAQDALTFLNDIVAEKVRCAQTESHRPAFEGETGDSPAHFMQKGEGHPDVGESG
jgi:hypothetical protein